MTRRRLEIALGGLWLLDGALREPGWLAAVNHHAGQLLARHGAAFAVAAALGQLAIGLAVPDPRWRRAAPSAGIALAVTYGLSGQDLGGLLTGRATGHRSRGPSHPTSAH